SHGPPPLSSIPDELTLQDDNLLCDVDNRCIRSLGGRWSRLNHPGPAAELRSEKNVAEWLKE
ncbi:hypothetical protein V8E53_014546, partial [Lactarius tabidus]